MFAKYTTSGVAHAPGGFLITRVQTFRFCRVEWLDTEEGRLRLDARMPEITARGGAYSAFEEAHMQSTNPYDDLRVLVDRREGINRELARNGVRFGIYKHGEFIEQLFPYDPHPQGYSRRGI